MPLATYLVGGAVRDQLLGLPVQEKDYVVVGASPEIMVAQGFKPIGKDFPVFLHPQTKAEYALARTERKIKAGYHGFEFYTADSVTLEEDLARRDLTINAIAIDERGQLIDPFNGQQDLRNRVLRHVSDAFVEDPVRALRVARFAARFQHLGFKIADETLALLIRMGEQGEFDALVAERVWQETTRALKEFSPSVYFKVLHQCGALSIIFPEIAALFGIPTRLDECTLIDSGELALGTLDQASQMSDNNAVRFAALTQALGKALIEPDQYPIYFASDCYRQAPFDALRDRYKISREFYDLARLTAKVFCVWFKVKNLSFNRDANFSAHTEVQDISQAILILFETCDAFRRPHRFAEMITVWQACCKAAAIETASDIDLLTVLDELQQELKKISPPADVKNQAIKNFYQQEKLSLLTRAALC